MSKPVQVAIAGALGRMGQAVADVARSRNDVEICALFDKADIEGEARRAAFERADVVIDFTAAKASADLAQAVAERGRPALVIGSTGFSPEEELVVGRAAERAAIVKSGNFSLGVNVLLGLVRQAARSLAASAYDIEVFEAHHRRKLDAPSGTALMLGEAAAQGRAVALKAVEVHRRDAVAEPRPQGAIGFSVMRGGGIVGEHSVVFAAEDEILTLAHSARDRSLFARGAVEAALWVAGKPPGLYDMQDVLGFGRVG